MKKDTLHIDLRPNTLHIPEIRKQAEDHLLKSLTAAVPAIIERQRKLPPFMIREYGAFSSLMDEARHCYEYGFVYASVSLMCIAAEKFTMELSNKNKGNQDKRLMYLKQQGAITSNHYENLHKISRMRDKYMHPKKIEERDAETDALEAIRLFNQVIQERFHEKYEVRDGVIFEKTTNQAATIIVP